MGYKNVAPTDKGEGAATRTRAPPIRLIGAVVRLTVKKV